MTEGFDKILKEFEQERTHNTLIWFGGLCLAGVICLVVAGYCQGRISDFLVNMAAGFISAAVISLVIERSFTHRQQENQRIRALFEGARKYELLREQALADDDYILDAIGRCQRLLEQSENKSLEAKLDRYNLIVEIAREANKRNTIAMTRLEQGIAVLRHIFDDYYFDLRPIVGEGLEAHLSAMQALIETKLKVQAIIRPYIEDTQERIKQLSKTHE